MGDVVPISEAKANLSKLVKRARAGEVIYLGAYGRADAVLAPVPARQPLAVGVWREQRAQEFSYDSDQLIVPDEEFNAAVIRAVDTEPASQ